MAHPETFEAAIEASHHALDEITRGNPNPFFELYSDREDATLANPYGPPARGRREIERGRPASCVQLPRRQSNRVREFRDVGDGGPRLRARN
jgi:hypothetical protein